MPGYLLPNCQSLLSVFRTLRLSQFPRSVQMVAIWEKLQHLKILVVEFSYWVFTAIALLVFYL